MELERELKSRTKILEYLSERDVRDYDQVTLVMRQFYADPKKLMDQIEAKKLKFEGANE